MPPPPPLTFRLGCGRTASALSGDAALKGLFDCLVYFMTNFVDDAIKALLCLIGSGGVCVLWGFTSGYILSSRYFELFTRPCHLRQVVSGLHRVHDVAVYYRVSSMFEDQRDGRV